MLVTSGGRPGGLTIASKSGTSLFAGSDASRAADSGGRPGGA